MPIDNPDFYSDGPNRDGKLEEEKKRAAAKLRAEAIIASIKVDPEATQQAVTQLKGIEIEDCDDQVLDLANLAADYFQTFDRPDASRQEIVNAFEKFREQGRYVLAHYLDISQRGAPSVIHRAYLNTKVVNALCAEFIDKIKKNKIEQEPLPLTELAEVNDAVHRWQEMIGDIDPADILGDNSQN